LRYLSKLWHEFSRVEQTFPQFNLLVDASAKDRHARANSAAEMLAIAHHLYCSRSDGVAGDFAEFGCFKGFSTCMLSLACRELDVPMHVFDSFEGLPPSQSTYYRAGDFTGSRAEVERNVRELGCIECVTFHEGYFSESVQALREERFVAIWVDVDLEISARDAMGAFGRLAPEGAVFSHETEPRYFEGWIWDVRHPDRVIAPILDAYQRHAEVACGVFLTGCTGGFWRESSGKPILHHDAFLYLLDVAKTVASAG
jgi:O-methyltransferase